MNLTEIIEKLQALRNSLGDVQVGYQDNEFLVFDAVTCIEMRRAKKTTWADDPELGEIYIGIS